MKEMNAISLRLSSLVEVYYLSIYVSSFPCLSSFPSLSISFSFFLFLSLFLSFFFIYLFFFYFCFLSLYNPPKPPCFIHSFIILCNYGLQMPFWNFAVFTKISRLQAWRFLGGKIFSLRFALRFHRQFLLMCTNIWERWQPSNLTRNA